MTPERWQQIETIFNEAVVLKDGERTMFLARACAGDDGLRREIEGLLAQDGDGFIASVIQDVADGLPTAPWESGGEEFRTRWTVAPTTWIAGERGRDQDRGLVGQRVGVYNIVGQIGQGGMGTVYRAQRDGEFQQQVALKIVRRGMDTEFVLRRFRYERQILARLEHPNIARLLDGGTTEDGRPYFVMEYIEGQSITRYCAERRLSVPERLQLFRTICAAVQYAHQNLVIHRDLKPGNILVTEGGVVKLLDFGIAKLLEPDPMAPQATMTETSQRLMTPDYASPEQALGQSISTASDVYSLGVVLYELLTGQRPHRFRNYSPAEIERTLRDTGVERPSVVVRRDTQAPARLGRQLSGDLDNIALMALRKEPARRYQSAEQLSEDILRHLSGLPVTARRDNLAYRAAKFVQRNRLAVGAAVLVFISLVAGLAAAEYQARRAERRFQQVRRLANSFLFDFHEKIANVPGTVEAQEAIVKTALEYLDSLAQEASGDEALLLDLAKAYLKVGDVQGNPWTANLGHGGDAMQSYQKALNLLRLIGAGEMDDAVLRVRATAQRSLGMLQSETGDKRGALSTLDLGLKAAEELVRRAGTQQDLSLNELFLGHICDVQIDMGDIQSALRSAERSLEWARRRASQFPGDDAQAAQAVAYGRLIELTALMGDVSAALEHCRRSTLIYEDLVARQPHNLAHRRGLRGSYSWLGALYGSPHLVNLDDPSAGIKYARQALQVAEQLAAEDPKNVRTASDLAMSHARLGDVLGETEPARAVAQYTKCVAVMDAFPAPVLSEFRFELRRAICLTKLGHQLSAAGDDRTALRHLLPARDTLLRLATRDEANTQLRIDLHLNLLATAEALLKTGDRTGALEHYRQSLTNAEKMVAASTQDANARYRLLLSYDGLAHYYETLGGDLKTAMAERLGHWRAARDWRERALSGWDEWSKHAVSSAFNTKRREQAARLLAHCDAELNRLVAAER